MQDNAAYREYKNVAKAVIGKYCCEKKADCRVLYKIIKKDFSIIEKAFRTAQKLEKTNLSLSQAFEWIADNYYIIDARKNQCLKGIKALRNISCTRVNYKSRSFYLLPTYFASFKDYLKLCDVALNETILDAYISAVNRKDRERPCFSDFYSFELLFLCVAVSLISDLCNKLLENPYASNLKLSDMLGRCISSLKFIASYNFEKSFENCETEEYLRRDPSGFYSHMSKETKNLYRMRISYLSRKSGISETEFAKELLEKARNAHDEHSRHIGYYLYPYPPKKYGIIYFCALLMGTVSVIAGVSVITPFAVFLTFPVWEAVKQICDKIMSLAVKSFPLPRLELNSIPDTDRVLVVITTLLTGEKNDNELFTRLENMYLSCGMKNVYFAILGDFPDSNTAILSDDDKIFSNAESRLLSLNSKYSENFFLFIRNRTYSKTQNKFMGYERKRGAVTSLVKYLCGKDNGSFIETRAMMPEETCNAVRYVITLDSDTIMPPDSVRELAGIMLHPLNRPIIDKKAHKVVSGYGIMQPKITPELKAAGKTLFTNIMCDTGGIDIYSFAGFDLYQSVFGEAVFCGKGIFDKYAFDEVINNKETDFPLEAVLSHDILEGEKLRTALVNDLEFTDGFPKNILSYLNRQHRWIRGDTQNLAFLKGYVTNSTGRQVKNNLSFLSKFKLFDNFRRSATPIFSFALLLFANFLPAQTSSVITLFCLFYIIFPVISDFAAMLSELSVQCAARRFFSKGVTAGIWQSFLRSFLSISMLPKNAFSSLDAILRSFWRLNFSKKHLLEWITASQSDTFYDNGILFYIQKNLTGAIIGTLQFIFSQYGILKVIGFLWFLFPFFAFASSKETKLERIRINQTQKDTISLYAKDMWQYFENTVNADENFLPIDNLQLFPCEIIAHRTSPTNIGLYLISILAARDFGFIETQELLSRLDNTLCTLEKMDKWHGHLYNWYDTQNLNVLNPKYVSSVDSGNFLACLISLKEGIKQYVCEKTELLDIIVRIEKLFENTDVSKIYDYSRDLFSLGISFENDKETMSSNCYDMLMSEARTLSYIALAARKVPKQHRFRLQRPLIKSGDHIGIASWTGTAFEYFMPAMFIPVPKSSLSYEALRFAFLSQRKRCAETLVGKVWGISESGYFAFDSDMNYRYKAFGIPELGFKRGLEKDLVISPYSSFLSLCLDASLPLANLKRLKKSGAYGKYGFYEAYDFTPDRCAHSGALIKSYMSHHVGMSIISCANACFDNIFVNRFMSEPRMNSAKELVEERIPVNAVIRRIKKVCYDNEKPEQRKKLKKLEEVKFSDVENPFCKVISDGHSGIIATDAGYIKLYSGKLVINLVKNEKYNARSGFFSFLEYNNKIHSTSYLPLENKNTKYSLEYSGALVTQKCKNDDISAAASFSVIPDSSVISVKLSAKPKTYKLPESISAAFCFEPIITNEVSYFSHPAFSALFVTCEYDDKEKILIYKRKDRSDPSHCVYLGVCLSDKNADFDFATNKNDLFGTAFTKDIYENVFSFETKNLTGACINPVCFIKTKLSHKNGYFSCRLLLVLSKSREKVYSLLCKTRKEHFDACQEKAENNASLLSLNAGIVPGKSTDNIVSKMVTSIIYPAHLQESEQMPYNTSKGCLWETGISGDIPIVSIKIPTANSAHLSEKYIRAYLLLRKNKISLDMALIFSDSEKYRKPIQNAVNSVIESCASGEYLKKQGGGIYPIDISSLSDKGRALMSFSSYVFDCTIENCRYSNTNEKNLKAYNIITKTERKDDFSDTRDNQLFFCGNGYFDSDYSYTILKDKNADIKLPQSMVLSGKMLSCVITHNSLGYTFASNSAIRRITPFGSDSSEDMYAERLFIKQGEDLYDIIAISDKVKYGAGYALYEGNFYNISYSVRVYIPEKIPFKILDVKIDSKCECELLFAVKPVMGQHMSENRLCSIQPFCDKVTFNNPFSEHFSKYTGILQSDFDNAVYETFESGPFERHAVCTCVLKSGISDIRFSLGACKEDSKKAEDFFLSELQNNDGSLLKSAKEFAMSFIPGITIRTKNDNANLKSLQVMFNFWLAYQNGICRFMARSGFYQSGGAFGFRDQLQDAIMLMYARSDMTKAHIIRAAAHQFYDGDALHWWHATPPESVEKIQGNSYHSGIRSTCSDDYLWLVYAVCEYIKFTSDNSILETPVRYACGENLENGESEKYIRTTRSDKRESLLAHCTKALDRAYSLVGKKGLCLLGSGDWSDGLNKAGENLLGESVWLSMFLKLITKSFIELCEKYDIEAGGKYTLPLKKLSEAINKHGYDCHSGYFARAWYDDGTPIGVSSCDECRIDLLPQAFSVIADCGDKEKKLNAINKAYNILYNKEWKIFKLLSPAFDKTQKNPGYIKGYVPGIRENGGQYTHAAVWGTMAMIDAAFFEKGKLNKELLQKGCNVLLNLMPPIRGLNPKLYSAYKCEPYVLCGDIYSNEAFPGRGGWSWYTGSAGWLWRAVLYSFLGISIYDIQNADKARFEFSIKAFYVPFIITEEFSVELNFENLGASYKIEYCISHADSGLIVDGKKSSSCIKISQGDHKIIVFGENI